MIIRIPTQIYERIAININIIQVTDRAVMMKISNSQRAKKLESAKLNANGLVRTGFQGRHLNRLTNEIVSKRYVETYGYDYEPSGSKVLKWMKQDFETKLNKYLGGKHHVGKMSRMEKIRRKEENDFSPKFNPLVSIFDKVEKKLINQIKYDSILAIAPFL